jgi:hypothetical protein
MSYNDPYRYQPRESKVEKAIIYIALTIVTIGLIYLLLAPRDESYISEYESKIKLLELKVDSLHNLNDGLVYKIDTLNQKIVRLDKAIFLQDNRIITLKKQTNEKINSVDFFNDDELERFFTERYRQHSDTIENPNSKTRN